MNKSLKNIGLDLLHFDFKLLLDRNILLFSATLLFLLTNSLMYSSYNEKYNQIIDLEDEQKIANEKFITAQILSEKLNSVYNLFESNLASGKNDVKNKEANVKFLSKLYTLTDKIGVEISAVEPGGKKNKGYLTYIPYSLQIKCDYEELGKLITALESNDRLITVDDIIIKNGTEKIKTSNQNNIDAINNLNVYLSISTVTINKSRKK